MRVAFVITVAALTLSIFTTAATANHPACPGARQAINHYKTVTWKWQVLTGTQPTPAARPGRHVSCAYLRWARNLWWERAMSARRAYYHLPNVQDWRVAARITQRVFPGTYFWLMSCSGAEGSHGRWVRYGGSPYYPGYEHTGAVGGWLQYRWPTFKGHYRHALDDLRSRGFTVPGPLRNPGHVRAWRSPLAQALAGGWGILHGQRSHWFASIGRGC